MSEPDYRQPDYREQPPTHATSTDVSAQPLIPPYDRVSVETDALGNKTFYYWNNQFTAPVYMRTEYVQVGVDSLLHAQSVIHTLERELDIARHDLDMVREGYDANIRAAYKLLGIEDDGELRMKWVLLAISSLVKHPPQT